MRIVIGGIMQESNTFSPAKSTMDYFKTVFLVGDEMIRMEQVQSEIAGFYRAAKEERDMELVPAFFTHALASGTVPSDTYEMLKGTLLKTISEAGPVDGILLALHGAMVAENCDDAEGELLSEIRSIVGNELPIVSTFDFHANITKRIVGGVNALVAYQTFPHTDHAETGYKAAKLLFAIVRREVIPALSFIKLPMIVQAENSQTTSGPMERLMREARLGESRGDAIVTSLFPVQPWLDIEEMGCSVVVVAETQEKAEQECRRLANLFWQERYHFEVRLHTVEEMVQLATSRQPAVQPILISDSADSSGAGATGDSNEVLRELLRLGAADKLNALLAIVDPEVVGLAIQTGVGQSLQCRIGRKLDPAFGEPLPIEAYVKRIGDGKYMFGKGFYTNMPADMGRCVVLQIGKLSILVMEKTSYTIAPEMYLSMGLDPKDADLVLVKSASQFKACFADISREAYYLKTTGSSTPDLKSLKFTKLPVPFYPFNDLEWKGESR